MRHDGTVPAWHALAREWCRAFARNVDLGGDPDRDAATIRGPRRIAGDAQKRMTTRVRSRRGVRAEKVERQSKTGREPRALKGTTGAADSPHRGRRPMMATTVESVRQMCNRSHHASAPSHRKVCDRNGARWPAVTNAQARDRTRWSAPALWLDRAATTPAREGCARGRHENPSRLVARPPLVCSSAPGAHRRCVGDVHEPTPTTLPT